MPRQEETEKLQGVWTDRLAWALTLLFLVATAAGIVLFVVIALNPTVSLNPYPPSISTPSPEPSPTPTVPERTPIATPTRLAVSMPTSAPSPTPLRAVVPTPAPVLTMPFSAAVAIGQGSLLPNCGEGVLAGTVTDQEGEALVDYPIHVWGAEMDVIVLSGSAPSYGDSGWEVILPEAEERETSIWYVQLHFYDIHNAHPALSQIVQVLLPERCPQAAVYFEERLSR